MVDLAKFASILMDHPAVRGAQVTTIDHNGRDVAIGVAEYSTYVCGPELREYVWQQLGADCGLAGVLPVQALPLVGDALDADRVGSAVAAGTCTVFESPADPLEERLSTIWTDAMNLKWIGVHDDFLDLGGDSVIAIKILSAIEEEFGQELDMFAFMDAYSIRGVADMLRERRATARATSARTTS
jgi:hypothetical protein